jgi:hypothetical protein
MIAVIPLAMPKEEIRNVMAKWRALKQKMFDAKSSKNDA